MEKEKEQFYKEIYKNVKAKKFQRQHVTAYSNKDLFSADLVDVSKYARFNKGNHFLLTIIDVYSRYAWVVPVKNKSALNVLEAFKSMNQIPKNLWVDEGKEFFNSSFKLFNIKNGINMYHTYSEIKGAFIERFNRTLKEKIEKYLDSNRTKVYIDELPAIVKKYNETKHSITKETPTDIYFGNSIPDQYKVIEEKEGRFKVGDYVRLNRSKSLFEKGYTYRFTKEVYKIKEIHCPPYPIMYTIEDTLGEEIIGRFYDNEMELTQVPNFKVFEKVIKQKKEGNKMLYQIKYQEYDDPKFFQWVTKKQLDFIKKN